MKIFVTACIVLSSMVGSTWGQAKDAAQKLQAGQVKSQVEQTLKQLRVHFPGKTDNQIIKVVRGYVLHDDPKEKDELRWLAERLERADKQRQMVETITNGGGDIIYDYQPKSGNGWFTGATPPGPEWLRDLLGIDLFVNPTRITPGGELGDAFLEQLNGLTQLEDLDLSNTKVTEAGLKNLNGLPRLQSLNLGSMQISGSGLEYLKQLPQLKSLDLTFAKIGDAGLEHLKGLTQLRNLSLAGTQVTDAGLELLKGLTQLRKLNLDGTRVTDAGLERLKGFGQLYELRLGETQVTDAGLERLKGLAQLKTLVIDDKRITDAGVKKLKQALPNCWIAVFPSMTT